MKTVAAIDVGSNAIRLATRKISSTGVAMGAGYRRWGLRLGTDVFSRGAITAEHQENLIAIFADIAMRLRRANVDSYRAVGTSAMREARNGSQVARRIKRATGVEIEIINGEQELMLARSILLRSLGSVPPDTLLVDLGGGSLELDRADRRVGLSMPLGTVRLIELYPELRRPISNATLGRLRGRIREDLRQHIPRPGTAPLAVGTGGNLDAMARIIPVRGCPVPAIEVRNLPRFCQKLAAMTPRERAKKYNLRRDRADLILPAALVVQATVDLFRLNAFVVPGTGLRESILHDLVGSPTADVAARRVLVRFGQDPHHADVVMRLAEQLFDITAPLHGLWAPARAAMQAAVYLRDLGALVDPSESLPHGIYLLEHLHDLPLDVASRRVAACVVTASHGESTLGLRRQMTQRERRVADVLTAVCEMARGMSERRSRQPLRADLLSKPLVIETHSKVRPPVRAKTALEKALKRRIRIL